MLRAARTTRSKRLGIVFPTGILLRADEVIE